MKINEYDLSLLIDRIATLEYADDANADRIGDLEAKFTKMSQRLEEAQNNAENNTAVLARAAHLKRPITLKRDGKKTIRLHPATLADIPRTRGRLSLRFSRSRSRRDRLRGDS